MHHMLRRRSIVTMAIVAMIVLILASVAIKSTVDMSKSVDESNLTRVSQQQASPTTNSASTDDTEVIPHTHTYDDDDDNDDDAPEKSGGNANSVNSNAAEFTTTPTASPIISPPLTTTTTEPSTSEPSTSAPMTSAPMTSAPMTSAPIETERITLAPIESDRITSPPITSPLSSGGNANIYVTSSSHSGSSSSSGKLIKSSKGASTVSSSTSPNRVSVASSSSGKSGKSGASTRTTPVPSGSASNKSSSNSSPTTTYVDHTHDSTSAINPSDNECIDENGMKSSRKSGKANQQRFLHTESQENNSNSYNPTGSHTHSQNSIYTHSHSSNNAGGQGEGTTSKLPKCPTLFQTPLDDFALQALLSANINEDMQVNIGADLRSALLAVNPVSFGGIRLTGFPIGSMVTYINSNGALETNVVGTDDFSLEFIGSLADISEQLNSVTFESPAGSDTDFILTATVQSANDPTFVQAFPFNITLLAVADMPTIQMTPTTIVAVGGDPVEFSVTVSPSDDNDNSETLSIIFTVGPSGLNGSAIGSLEPNVVIPGVSIIDLSNGIYEIVVVSDTPEERKTQLDIFLSVNGLSFVPREGVDGTFSGMDGICVEVISTERANGDNLAPPSSTDLDTKTENSKECFTVVISPNSNSPTTSSPNASAAALSPSGPTPALFGLPVENFNEELSVQIVEDVPFQFGEQILKAVFAAKPTSFGGITLDGFPIGTNVAFTDANGRKVERKVTIPDFIVDFDGDIFDISEQLRSLVITSAPDSDLPFTIAAIVRSKGDPNVTQAFPFGFIVLAVADVPGISLIPGLIEVNNTDSVPIRINVDRSDDGDDSEFLSIIFVVGTDNENATIGTLSAIATIPGVDFTVIGNDRYIVEADGIDAEQRENALDQFLNSNGVEFTPRSGSVGFFMNGICVKTISTESATAIDASIPSASIEQCIDVRVSTIGPDILLRIREDATSANITILVDIEFNNQDTEIISALFTPSKDDDGNPIGTLAPVMNTADATFTFDSENCQYRTVPLGASTEESQNIILEFLEQNGVNLIPKQGTSGQLISDAICLEMVSSATVDGIRTIASSNACIDVIIADTIMPTDAPVSPSPATTRVGGLRTNPPVAVNRLQAQASPPPSGIAVPADAQGSLFAVPIEDINAITVIPEDVDIQLGKELLSIISSAMPESIGGVCISGFPDGVLIAYTNRNGDPTIDVADSSFILELTGIETVVMMQLNSLILQNVPNSDSEYTLDVTVKSATDERDQSFPFGILTLAVADQPAIDTIPDILSVNGNGILPIRINANRSPDEDNSETLSVKLKVGSDENGLPIGTLKSRTGVEGVTFTDFDDGCYLIESEGETPQERENAIDEFLFVNGIEFIPRSGADGLFEGADGICVEAISTEVANKSNLAPGSPKDINTKEESVEYCIDIDIDGIPTPPALRSSVVMENTEAEIESTFVEETIPGVQQSSYPSKPNNMGMIVVTEDTETVIGSTIIMKNDGKDLSNIAISGFPLGTSVTYQLSIDATFTTIVASPDDIVDLTGPTDTEIRDSLDSLMILPPTDFSGVFNLDITATTMNDDITSGIVIVEVQMVADKPMVTIGVDNVNVPDGKSVTITSNVTVSRSTDDDSEVLSVEIFVPDIPDAPGTPAGIFIGPAMSNVTVNFDNEARNGLQYILSVHDEKNPEVIETLLNDFLSSNDFAFLGSPNVGGVFNITITAVSTDNASNDGESFAPNNNAGSNTVGDFDTEIEKKSDILQITLIPMASAAPSVSPTDAPLIAGKAAINEDTATQIGDTIDINGIMASLSTIVLSGFPAGSVVSFTNNLGSFVTMNIGSSTEAIELVSDTDENLREVFRSLTVTPPTNFAGNFDITFVATGDANDGNIEETISVSVLAVADMPHVTLSHPNTTFTVNENSGATLFANQFYLNRSSDDDSEVLSVSICVPFDDNGNPIGSFSSSRLSNPGVVFTIATKSEGISYDFKVVDGMTNPTAIETILNAFFLGGLDFTPTNGVRGEFAIVVKAISTEMLNHDAVGDIDAVHEQYTDTIHIIIGKAADP